MTEQLKDNIIKQEDPKLIRKMDVNLQIVDITKIQNTIDWKPTTSFENTIQEILNYQRIKVRISYLALHLAPRQKKSYLKIYMEYFIPSNLQNKFFQRYIQFRNSPPGIVIHFHKSAGFLL